MGKLYTKDGKVLGTKDGKIFIVKNNVPEFNIEKDINEYKEHGIELSQFSDSILIYSSNSDIESLKIISEVVCNVMRTSISSKIPLKGAIAKGTVTCDTIKQLYFGQALIDAYLLEENVKYYGVLAHNSVESAKENLLKIRETVSGDPRKYIDNSIKVINSNK